MIGPGDRFLERFVVERSLGVGGFGEVWLARSDDGAAVAIKVQRSDVHSAIALRSFAREGVRAAALSHPHLVRVFESGVLDGRAYLVMEHLDGSTLDDELRRRRRSGDGVPVGLVRRWAKELCEAIDALHAASLIHRDLKPANVMVVGDVPRIKVLDLGLAHDAKVAAEELTTLGRVKGTTAYMSPEQALGERVGPASDVFALTTIVFELLTGLRPWLLNATGGMLPVGHRIPASTNDSVEVLRRLSSGRRPMPSMAAVGLPPELDHVFVAGWARDPDARPVPILAWAARLDAALARVPADDSAWATPRRNDKSSIVRARAPAIEEEPEEPTPVAAAPEPVVTVVPEPAQTIVAEAVTATKVPQNEPTRLAPTRMLASAPKALSPAVLTVAALGLASIVLAAALLRANEPAAEVARAPEPSPSSPTIRGVAAPISSAPADVASPPQPLVTAPRSSPRPQPTPRATAVAEPDPVRALRARLDRGESIDAIARSTRELARALAPAERQAIERWITSATELDDRRPLELALDALSRAR